MNVRTETTTTIQRPCKRRTLGFDAVSFINCPLDAIGEGETERDERKQGPCQRGHEACRRSAIAIKLFMTSLLSGIGTCQFCT